MFSACSQRVLDLFRAGGELKWSLWDRVDIDGVNMTLQQLLSHIEQTYGLSVSMMSYGTLLVYHHNYE